MNDHDRRRIIDALWVLDQYSYEMETIRKEANCYFRDPDYIDYFEVQNIIRILSDFKTYLEVT